MLYITGRQAALLPVRGGVARAATAADAPAIAEPAAAVATEPVSTGGRRFGVRQ